MEHYLLISDAAKEVRVESHVLRYWEEELKLSIGRNEQGHRCYTPEDVERFKQIKNMKEKGLQLKAIKMIMKNGDLNLLSEQPDSSLPVTAAKDADALASREEKAQKLQWLFRQLVREAIQESNKELAQEIKESVVKELDYQFRTLEERNEERENQRQKREEEHYQRVDELLRKKSRRKNFFKGK